MAAMASSTKFQTGRLTADERRAQLIEAAVTEFAVTGLHGTSTEVIARRAGISHAYLFRLYPTKKALFIACADRCFERTLETFRTAAAATPEADQKLHAMGEAYVEMLADRELLRLQMQLYAACSDPEICAVVRAGFDELVREVTLLSGAAPDEVQSFFAHGMLLNVAAALDAPDLGEMKSWGS
jgi:AcrR family transcriptional regulator